MKKLNKYIAVLLCAIITLSFNGVFVWAYGSFGDFIYVDDGSEVEIIGYNGSSSSVSIPSKINGLPVTSIGESCFRGKSEIQGFIIPSSVRHFGDRAFSGTGWLTNYDVDEFPIFNNVLIDYKDNYQTEVTLPSNVKVIGYGAFANATFEKINLTSDINQILDEAFYGCENLSSITIPYSVDYIGKNVFLRSSGLENIFVEENNQNYSSSDGVLFNAEKTSLITCPEGKFASYSIPNTVERIEPSAFNNCKLISSVIIPDSVTQIGNMAFYDCYTLSSAMLGKSVEKVGEFAFLNCKSLNSINVTSKISEIGDYAFGFFHDPDTNIVSKNDEYMINLNNSDGTPFKETGTYKYMYRCVNNNFDLNFTVTNADVMLGDVNENGEIEAADARLALRNSAQLEPLYPLSKLAADLNRDGIITAMNARTILRVSANLQSF